MQPTNETKRTAQQSTNSFSRRTFLEAIGMAGLASAGVMTTSAATGNQPSSPGSVSSLSEYIENPRMFGENQEHAHVPATVPFDSVDGALDADGQLRELEERWSHSPNFTLLNGTWDFAYHDKPADVPDSYSSTKWDQIQVPKSWQTAGYDELVMLNVPLTWVGIDEATNTIPPEVPDDYNPVGTYRRTFSVPQNWDGRETFLHFEGVKQAFFVWVDDQYVGFNEGSMTAAEFDVTDFVSPGSDHEVTVQVYRFSDGEALETQDMYRFSGIYRSVYLFSTPDVHTRDFFVRTDLDSSFTDATLRVDAELANYTGADRGTYELLGHLYNPDGSKETTLSGTTNVGADRGMITLEKDVVDPDKWSDENPTLYNLVLELKDGSGTTVETQLEKVGFREYTISDQQLRNNGEPVMIRGTNRHEHSPEHGRYVPHETNKEDFELMKQFNLNSVRCSHYPNDPSMYSLADEYGVYLQDEVNVETHWNKSLADDAPEYWDAYLERFRRMVQRDKNRPSIFAWSTGNEAGQGPPHFMMAEYVSGKDYDAGDGDADDDAPPAADPTRFLMHQDWNGDAPYVDIFGPRYPLPSTLESVGTSSEDRPVVMGEYAHAQGNSLWNFDELWQLMQPANGKSRELRNLQGGWIWDWVNQGVDVTKTFAPSFTTPDRSGNGYKGSLLGNPEIVPNDGTGKAVNFDGEDDFIDIGGAEAAPELDFTEPGFTIRVRVKGEQFTSVTPFVTRGDQQYALKIADPETNTAYEGTEPILEGFIFDDTWLNVSAQVPSGWSDGWNTVTFVCTDTELLLYVNGQQVGSSTHSATSISSPGYDYPVQVGHNAQQTSRYADATIDWVRMFDRPLSASELAGTPPSSPRQSAVLWYPLDEFTKGQEETITYSYFDHNTTGQNGMVWSHRDPEPELWQVKKSQQPVSLTPVDLSTGTIQAYNYHSFWNLDEYDCKWELKEDDTTIQSGTLTASAAPGESTQLTIPFTTPRSPTPGAEYWLSVSFCLAQDTLYANAGHVKAFEQYEIPFDVPEAPVADTADMPAVSVTETSDRITVSGNSFEYTFDAVDGKLTDMRYDGNDVVTDSTSLRVYDWSPLDNQVNSVTVETPNSAVARIEIDASLTSTNTSGVFDTTFLYHVLGSGDLLVGVDMVPDGVSGELDRVGLQLDLPDGFDDIEWYGRGPEETYEERKGCMEMGIYGGSVADQYVPYVPPQQNGNKTETRWAALTGSGRTGLAVFGYPEMNVSLSQYENVPSANHKFQLEPRDGLRLNVDHELVNAIDGYLFNWPGLDPRPMSFVVGVRPFATDRTSGSELAGRSVPFAFAEPDRFSDFDATLSGSTIEAGVTIQNATGDSQTISVPFHVNGDTVATRTVDLPAGSQERVSFTYDVSGATSEFFQVSIGDLPTVTVPEIGLAGTWKFKPGDDQSWKSTSYDASGWETVELPSTWEAHSGYTKNPAYGWYRTTVTIPEAWNGQPVSLPVGKIDDEDWTYVNGTQVGHTSGWNVARVYEVPPSAIDYGEENLIAIRVYDRAGAGGLWDGPLSPVTAIGPTGPTGPSPVVGDQEPTDPDGDGLYEDITGDGAVTFADVEAYAEHLNDPSLRSQLEAFDYNGNDRIGHADLIRLWRAAQQ